MRLPAYQGGDLARLVYHPHSLPVTDVNPPVHTHGQTLREGELGCRGRAPVPTVIRAAGDTALPSARHHLVVRGGGVNSLQLEDPPDLGRNCCNQSGSLSLVKISPDTVL